MILKKPSFLDQVKGNWILLMAAVSVIASCAVDSYRLAQVEKAIEKKDAWSMHIEQEVADTRIELARACK